MNPAILIVDDDTLLLSSIRRNFRKKYKMVFASSPDTAFELLASNKEIEIIISDFKMPGMNGLEFLQKVNDLYPRKIKIFMSGHAGFETTIKVINKSNVFRVLLKPATPKEIEHVIEEALEQFRLLKIEDSERLKTEFLSLLSHEIRTPLTSINNFLYLIQQEAGQYNNPKILEFVETVNKSKDRLLRTVDLVANVSEAKSKNVKINLQQLNISNDIIQPIIDKYKNNISEKNLELKLHLEDNIEILSDIKCLSEIFEQTLFNAICFTEKGEIEVELKEENDNIILSIKDTGIGISEDFQEKIFEPFTQAETGYSRKYDGNGLGLTLVKLYSDILGIEIKIDSEIGKGTKFIFEI